VPAFPFMPANSCTKLPFDAAPGSVLADVLVPDGGIFLDVIGEERYTFLRIEVDDFDVERAKPVDAALKRARFADDDAGETELADEAAAIPARSERCDHGELAIGALAAGVAEGVGFSVQRRIAKLHAAIVAGAEQRAAFIKNGSADGDAAFGEAFACFGESDREHRRVVVCVSHLHELYAVMQGEKRQRRAPCQYLRLISFVPMNRGPG
jgi:hypothetical protein